jgi:spore photoproduct lyase
MFELIYIEKTVLNHPQTQSICHRFPTIPQVTCDRYGEVFNRHAQNFRLQKQRPSLILARKFDHFILPTPDGYGIGGTRNFYFSHMLNCIYDCRYCFLQGMYNSAHYVIFINFEDFEQAIQAKIEEFSSEESYYFSGYDCDSLALEPLTHFVENILPTFKRFPHAYIELRTKSINTSFLLKQPPQSNCIIAFSLTPRLISEAFEHRTPSLTRRLKALQELQRKGWPIGLRFDPVIYCDDYQDHYREFFLEVFQAIQAHGVHSVSLGPFRLPKGIYKKMATLYPDEKLFAFGLKEQKSIVSYHESFETEMIHFCKEELLRYISPSRLFTYEIF